MTGTKKVGKTLKVSKGTWSAGPTTFTYKWSRNGKAIKGATKSHYKLTSKDKGKRITVKVTASGLGHVSAAKSVVAAKKVKKR